MSRGRRRAHALTTDPTIPRAAPRTGNAKQAERRYGPTEGRLVSYGTSVVLTDLEGNTWAAESVRIKQGSFGFNAEGVQKRPRPWVFNGPAIIVEGDWFLIHFLNGDPYKPVIDGGIGSLKRSDPLFFDAQPVGIGDPNAIRMRAGNIDPVSGVQTGSLQIRALDGGNAIEVMVGGAAFGVGGLRIVIDYDEGAIKLGQGLETHPVALGDAIVSAIKGLADDIIALNLAHTGPTTAPVPLLNATTLTAEAGTSLSAGPPMLSTIVKVQ